ncbi:hypothetical protein F4X88_20275 [Candidatus Poribacteria bacterium]|nr:hypothetical protein [Candidatus Poribacteria bacterium]
MPVETYRETPAGGDGIRRSTFQGNRTVYETEAHAFRRWVLSPEGAIARLGKGTLGKTIATRSTNGTVLLWEIKPTLGEE